MTSVTSRSPDETSAMPDEPVTSRKNRWPQGPRRWQPGRMKRRFSSDEIRATFLGFFTQRRHARIEAASIIPGNDPSLLFINAGMAPLKPYFPR
jgi:tRNA synthetases class II (A)